MSLETYNKYTLPFLRFNKVCIFSDQWGFH